MKRILQVVAIISAMVTLPYAGLAGGLFEVEVIMCTAGLCGTASSAVLREGKVKVDEDGDVKVELERAAPDATLCVVYRPTEADGEVPVGELHTSANGDFEGTVGSLEAQSSMGLFLLTDCADAALYVTGFTTHPTGDGDDDGVSDDDDSDDDNDGISDDDDSDADGDGIDDAEDCDGDHVASDVDTDDDNDGVSDDSDADDDNDGIVDEEDADPDCPGAFDDTGDEASLKASYKADLRDAAATKRAVCTEARDTLKEQKQALKSEFRARRDELRGK